MFVFCLLACLLVCSYVCLGTAIIEVEWVGGWGVDGGRILVPILSKRSTVGFECPSAFDVNQCHISHDEGRIRSPITNTMFPWLVALLLFYSTVADRCLKHDPGTRTCLSVRIIKRFVFVNKFSVTDD